MNTTGRGRPADADQRPARRFSIAAYASRNTELYIQSFVSTVTGATV